MKRIVCGMLVILLLVAWMPWITVEATEEVIASGNWALSPVTWIITSDGTLTIDGINNPIQGSMQYIWKDYSDVVTKIVIGDGITSIPDNAFSDMNNVTTVQLGSNITKIDERAFAGCTNLKEIYLPAKLEKLGVNAFYNCESLSTVTFAPGIQLTTIPEYAFYGTAIEELVTPERVETIESHAFGVCKSLKKVHLSEGLLTLEAYAFYDCSQLTDLYIPSTVSTLNNTFPGCDALENLEIYCHGRISSFDHLPELKKVVVGGNVRAIHSNCFASNPSLTDVTIADTVEVIGSGAFGYCTALRSLKLPVSLTRLEQGCFRECEITSLTIPAGVTLIDYRVFQDSALHEIIFTGDAPTFGMASFDGLVSIIYYPDDNPTWTEEVMQSYGGEVTWLPISDKHTHVMSTEKVEPDCISRGYTRYTCSICGGSYRDDYVYPPGHDYADATCTQPKTCKRDGCGFKFGSALGHNWDGSVEGIATCTVCGYSESHTHLFGTRVTEPGCLTEGYTTYTCRGCGYNYQSDYKEPAGHALKPATCDFPATCTRLGCLYTEGEALGHTWHDDTAVIKCCTVCGFEKGGYRVFLNGTIAQGTAYSWPDTVWVDGKEYTVKGSRLNEYIILEQLKPSVLTTYQYNDSDAEDIHTQYPTRMRVFFLIPNQGSYTLRSAEDYTDILKYSGSSIRIAGKKGIRMITSVNKEQKKKLTSGMYGSTLVEYGTVLAWAKDLEGGNPLVLGQPYAKSNYAYKRDVADPVYKDTGKEIQYTNVLVGFTNDQCKDDIAMRSYMILENRNGTRYTIYGGIVYRSIGYIAYQNRSAFKPGTNAYEYVWDIIHHVYGDQYDTDYKG